MKPHNCYCHYQPIIANETLVICAKMAYMLIFQTLFQLIVFGLVP